MFCYLHMEKLTTYFSNNRDLQLLLVLALLPLLFSPAGWQYVFAEDTRQILVFVFIFAFF